jgi:hypothetical protein
MSKLRYTMLFFAVAMPLRLAAQQESLQQCAANTVNQAHCNSIVEAMQITQPRVALAIAGGNPVPGASSTLGMRLGSVPRLSFGARVTMVRLELPPMTASNSTQEVNERVLGANFDASIGIYSGLSVAPTVGGVGSIDLVAGLGRVGLPDEDGFTRNVVSWGIGARLGILRESFTAPGVSVTAMYRGLSDIEYADGSTGARGPYFELSGNRMLSLRGVVGKRLLAFGTMAGVGYDRVTSDVTFGTDFTSTGASVFREDGFRTSRTTAFGSVQYTLLILSIVGEAGWQLGGDEFTAPLPSGQSSMTEKKAFFGSIALRLSI